MKDFVKKNAWQILTFIVSAIVFYALLSYRVNINCLKIEKIEAQEEENEDVSNEILQRVIVIETKIEDIKEDTDLLLERNDK